MVVQTLGGHRSSRGSPLRGAPSARRVNNDYFQGCVIGEDGDRGPGKMGFSTPGNLYHNNLTLGEAIVSKAKYWYVLDELSDS